MHSSINAISAIEKCDRPAKNAQPNIVFFDFKNGMAASKRIVSGSGWPKSYDHKKGKEQEKTKINNIDCEKLLKYARLNFAKVGKIMIDISAHKILYPTNERLAPNNFPNSGNRIDSFQYASLG